jgi:hypothetical protein
MENASTLLSVAGLAAVLLGFSTLAGAPGLRSAPGASGGGGLRRTVDACFAALALALLPLLLAALGASGSMLWRTCSAIAGLGVPVLVAFTWLAGRGAPTQLSALRALVVLADVAALVLAVANLANAAQLFHPVAPGPYVAAVLWQLLAAATRFLAATR